MGKTTRTIVTFECDGCKTTEEPTDAEETAPVYWTTVDFAECGSAVYWQGVPGWPDDVLTFCEICTQRMLDALAQLQRKQPSPKEGAADQTQARPDDFNDPLLMKEAWGREQELAILVCHRCGRQEQIRAAIPPVLDDWTILEFHEFTPHSAGLDAREYDSLTYCSNCAEGSPAFREARREQQNKGWPDSVQSEEDQRVSLHIAGTENRALCESTVEPVVVGIWPRAATCPDCIRLLDAAQRKADGPCIACDEQHSAHCPTCGRPGCGSPRDPERRLPPTSAPDPEAAELRADTPCPRCDESCSHRSICVVRGCRGPMDPERVLGRTSPADPE